MTNQYVVFESHVYLCKPQDKATVQRQGETLKRHQGKAWFDEL